MIRELTRRVDPTQVAAVTTTHEIVVAVTAGSVWLITGTAYLQVSRDSLERRLEDNGGGLWDQLRVETWLAHRGAYWRAGRTGTCINLRSEAGPADGYGVVTGAVEAVLIVDSAAVGEPHPVAPRVELIRKVDSDA